MLLLNEAREAPRESGSQAIILDLDLFRGIDLPSESSALWDLIERLHERIESIFEACVTDELRQRIE